MDLGGNKQTHKGHTKAYCVKEEKQHNNRMCIPQLAYCFFQRARCSKVKRLVWIGLTFEAGPSLVRYLDDSAKCTIISCHRRKEKMLMTCHYNRNSKTRVMTVIVIIFTEQHNDPTHTLPMH